MKGMTKKDKRGSIPNVGLEHVLREIHFYDLEIFEAVARSGSISAASRELRLHPPHVSKSIRRAELAAKSTFFQRSKTGVILTPEGRRFLDFSQSLSKLISSASLSENLKDDEPKRKLLMIAGTSFLTTYLSARSIAEIQQGENRYRFRLLEMGESQLVASALNGHFEIALHIKNLDWPKSWTTAAIGKLSWTLCGRARHPLGANTNEQDVKKYPFVMPFSLTGGEFRYGEDQCPLPVRSRIVGEETQTAEAGLQLVANSDQLIFVPEIMIQARVEQGLLQKINVRQWHPVRETLFLSAQSETVPNRVFEQLVKAAEKFSI
jgi:DNA-binding transcriptional LysR family regulator